MTDEAKSLEIAMSKIGQNKPTLDKCVESAKQMAAWKQEQLISQMKEFIAEYFYEHPHTSFLICSDEFQDLDDCFERVERYLKEE